MYQFDEVINRENTAAAKWNEVTSCQLVPLTTADMEFKVCPDILEAMQTRLSHGILGYTKPDKRFYDAIITFIKRHHQFDVTEEMIVCSTSGMPALISGIKACSKKGEGVILLSPTYTGFYKSISYTERVLKDCPLIYSNHTYKIDFSSLEELAKDIHNKVLILCSPHNPVGRVWSREELQKVLEICEQYDVSILSDEIHWDLILEGKHISLGCAEEIYKKRIILLTSPSKTFNLAGTQLAYSIIFNESLRTKFKEELLKLGQGEVISTFGYESLIAGYQLGDLWLKELISYIQENVNQFEKWLRKHHPEIGIIRPEGTYLIWLDCRNVKPDYRNWLLTLEKEGIYFTDGAYFGIQGEGFIRVNLALPKEELLKVLSHWEHIDSSM